MKNNKQILAITVFLCRGANINIDPYRANCDALHSTKAKCVRERFSDNIAGRIDVGVNQTSIGGLKQTALNAFAQVFGLMADALKV